MVTSFMKAIHVDSSTHALSWLETETPKPKSAEVLIKVHATAVNRADLLQRAGKYPVPAGESSILGLEVSGTVEVLGNDVTDFQKGEKVFCLLSGGGYAEYVSVPAGLLMRIPEGMSFEQAASIPEAFITAFLNLKLEAKLQNTETLLVHAGASGVGLAAVQLGNVFGATVFATAGSKEKCEFVERLGAQRCINYREADFSSALGDSSIDVVLDMVGQAHLQKNLSVLKYRGRAIMLSLISGSKTEINLVPLLRKNVSIKGSTLRDKSLIEKTELKVKLETEVLPLFKQGRITACVHKVMPIQDAEAAHQLVSQDLNIGKVVLKVS